MSKSRKKRRTGKAEVAAVKQHLSRVWELSRGIKDRPMLLEILKDAAHPAEVETLIVSMRPDLAANRIIITDEGKLQ